MACAFRPIGDSFAREVLGIHCWEPQQPETVHALRAALSEHGVLVFHRQALSEREIADFSALFGPLERVVRTEWHTAVVPEVGILSHLRDGNGSPIGGLGDGELQWHSDQSYMMHPATGAGLYAAEIAQQGGTTYWTNLQLAYDALPERLKRAVQHREAIFDYTKRVSSYQGKDQVLSEATKRKRRRCCIRSCTCIRLHSTKRCTSMRRRWWASSGWHQRKPRRCSRSWSCMRANRNSCIGMPGRLATNWFGTTVSRSTVAMPSRRPNAGS